MSFLNSPRRSFSRNYNDYEEAYDDRYEDDEDDDYDDDYEERVNPIAAFFGFGKSKKKNTYNDEYEDDSYKKSRSDYRGAQSDRRTASYSNIKSNIQYNSALGIKAEVTVLYPESFDDSASIVKAVKNGKITVFVFDSPESSSSADARRIVDYVCGAAEGMECTFDRLSNGIFCIAPKGVTISKKKSGYRG